MTNDVKVNPVLVKGLLIVAIIAAAILAANFFISSFFAMNEKLTKVNADILNLNQKTSQLADSTGSVATFTDQALLAVPQSDPSLYGIAQIKSAANASGLTIDNVSYSSGTTAGAGNMHKVSFGVDLSGNLTSFRAFLEILKGSSPISTIDNLRSAQESTNDRYSLTIVYYWADLPTKLPEITEPIKNLSSEDMALLQQISILKKPDGISITSQTTPTTGEGQTSRQNIFELAQ